MGLFEDIELLGSGGNTVANRGLLDRYCYIATGQITETPGAGTYTLTIPIPAGATIHDVVVDAVANWTNTGTATLTVGDGGNATGFFASANLKAAGDIVAGQSFGLAHPGTKVGGYVASSIVSNRYSAAARNVIAVATTSSTGGGAGVTRVSVYYALAGVTVNAVKV